MQSPSAGSAPQHIDAAPTFRYPWTLSFRGFLPDSEVAARRGLLVFFFWLLIVFSRLCPPRPHPLSGCAPWPCVHPEAPVPGSLPHYRLLAPLSAPPQIPCAT